MLGLSAQLEDGGLFEKRKYVRETLKILIKNHQLGVCFGNRSIKIGKIQRRVVWMMCKKDLKIHEAVHIFKNEITA